MTSDSYTGTCAVRHGTTSVVMELLGYIAESCATADCSSPGGGVHGEIL
jgi:hypothetical protein